MTLQEYLVKLGFSVDEPAMKKFVGAVSAAGARTAELGSVALETATAVELMVSRVARTYESLYYMSQRTGQSVQYIQKTQFGFKQIGLSAEEANQSIEGIASTLRTQPWLKSIFGGANTPQQVATNLGRSGLPYFLQVKFAEMIGMSEQTLFHMQHFAAVEAAAEEDLARRQRAAGLDPATLAEQSVEYGRALNTLESDLEIFGTRVASDFLGPTGKGIVLVDDFVQGLSKIDVATKGWLGTLTGLAGALGGVLLLGKALKWLFELKANPANALGKAGLVGTAVSVAGIMKYDSQHGNPIRTWLREQLGIEDPGEDAPWISKHHEPRWLAQQKKVDFFGHPQGGSSGLIAPKARSYAKVGDKISRAVDAFVKAGYPLASAQGMTAALYSENTAMDPANVNGIGMTGLGQWDTARRAKFQQLTDKPMVQGSFDEQLQFKIWELNNTEKATGDLLKRGGLTARGAAAADIHGYERPGPAGEASDMSRAGPLADYLSTLVPQQSIDSSKNVTLNATTDINIHGGGDASKAIKGYTDAHQDVNDSLLYQLQQPFR